MSVVKIVFLFAMLACLSADLISAKVTALDLDEKLEVDSSTSLSRKRRYGDVAQNIVQDDPQHPMLGFDEALEELAGLLKSSLRNKRSDGEPQERFFIQKIVGLIPDFIVSPIAGVIYYIIDKLSRFVIKLLNIVIPTDFLKKILPRDLWSFIENTTKEKED